MGENCEEFLKRSIRDIPAERIQLDEIWGFVGIKEAKKKVRRITSEEVGDS